MAAKNGKMENILRSPVPVSAISEVIESAHERFHLLNCHVELPDWVGEGF